MSDWNRRQEMEDEYNAKFGDPRTCPVHGCITSSADGMLDGVCGGCEHEASEAMDELSERSRRAAMSPAERAAEDAEREAWRARQRKEEEARKLEAEIAARSGSYIPF